MRLASVLLTVAAFLQAPQQHHLPPSMSKCGNFLVRLTRKQWQKPSQVIRVLAIRPAETIADIGAGTGYFSRRFARYAGKVYAVDIKAADLARIRKNAPANLMTILAAPDDPKLPEAGVDTIFFCDVLHHIENRGAYYRKLDRALKPGGRIVVIDFYKRELPIGPPVSRKIPREEMIAELKQAGFVLAESFDFLPYQYFLVFERTR